MTKTTRPNHEAMAQTVARLVVLAANATPGPWDADGHWVNAGGEPVAMCPDGSEAMDPELIAEMRNALPTLLDALEARSAPPALVVDDLRKEVFAAVSLLGRWSAYAFAGSVEGLGDDDLDEATDEFIRAATSPGAPALTHADQRGMK